MHPLRKRGVALGSLAAALVAVVALVAAGPAAAKPHTLVLAVAHGPVTAANMQLLDVPPAGSSIADTRTYYLPLTRPGGTAQIGYLTGVLTTVAVDEPSPGMELRTADLVFVVGGPADQIVVGGVSAYPRAAQTLPAKSVVVRPVVGGSGRYAGARGWCVTTHLANDTWTHVFHLTLP